jgi:hypothetical protein
MPRRAALPIGRPERELNIVQLNDLHELLDTNAETVRIRADLLRRLLRDLGQAYAALGNST